MSTTDVFTSTGTWTCPAYVTTVWARCWGGGGAGGGVSIAPAAGSNAGGGAAGGAFAEKLAITVTPGTVYTVTVGAVKTGSTGSGSAGNDSWFLSNTTVLAKGGAGGSSPATEAGIGAQGFGSTSGCIGDNKFAGGSGATGWADDTSGVGSGGGGAGSGAAGGAGSPGSGGGGGSTGGGQGGDGRTTAGAGNAGSSAGGGGAGAFATPGSFTHAGGTGAAGRVELEYTPAYSSAGGSIRAVAGETVDVTSAPTAIDNLTPAGGDIFLLVGNDSDAIGLWTWNSAGTAMTQVADDADGSYRDVREGTYAGTRVFVSLAAFIPGGYLDPLLFTWNSFFITPGASPVGLIRGSRPEGYVGVLPTVSGGGSCVVTHNLGSKFLLVAVAATASPFAFQKLGGSDWVIERTSLDTVTVKPPSAITAGDFEVILRKAV